MGGLGVGVPTGACVGVGIGSGVAVAVAMAVAVASSEGVAVGASVGVWAGSAVVAGVAQAAPTTTSAKIRLTRRIRTPLYLEVQKPGHFRVEHLAVLGLGRQKTLVVDEPRLLFDPLAPAIGAGVGQNRGAPFARQRRLAQAFLALRAAPAHHLSHEVALYRPGGAYLLGKRTYSGWMSEKSRR